MGDVDSDGDLDIITGKIYLDIIAGKTYYQNVIYLNDGTGNFDWPGSVRNFRLDDFDHWSVIAVGDVDGDGDLDIITGNTSAQNIVYLNDGKGNFMWPGSARNFGTDHDNTLAVVVGDIDGDGDLDLITGNEFGQNVVYLNDGRGNFDWPGSARNFGSGDNSTRSVAVGDVDSDDDLDIITGNYDAQNVVYLNDGAGNFDWLSSARNFGPGHSSTWSVAVGDVDGDDDLDIITGNQASYSSSAEKNVVYLNDGRGNFDWPHSARTFGPRHYENSSVVAVGDVDSDGDLDIITGNHDIIPAGIRDAQSVVYLNDGKGNFNTSSRNFGPNRDHTRSVAVGDVDGDGDLDIITGNYDAQNVIYLNDGTANFDSPGRARNFGTREARISSLAVGDMDGDGDLDIITGNYDAQNVIYLNDSTGNFDWPGSARNFGPGYNDTWSVVAVGDVDGDGDLDIINTGSSLKQSVVYLNDGKGNFDWPGSVRNIIRPDHGVIDSVVVGDVDGDGDLDIITGNNVVFLNDGKGNFDWPGSARNFVTRQHGSWCVAVGDVDSDGDLDIITGNNIAQNVVYLNDGIGNFDWLGSVHNFGSGDNSTRSVAAADVDSDGDLDIITSNDYYQNVVYLNDGIGNFDWSGSVRNFGPGDKGSRSVAVGDVDGDGDLDIITENNVVYLNDGTGNFNTSSRNFGPGDDDTSSVAVGDVDGDGDLDIITENNAVYLNGLRGAQPLPNNAPLIAVTRPLITGNAAFFSSPTLLVSSTIPITYTLFDPEGDQVGRIKAFYSLDGGSKWQPALAAQATITQTQNLTTGRWIVGANLVTQTISAQTSVPLTATLSITPSAPINQVEVWLATTRTNNRDLSLLLQSPTGLQVSLVEAGQATGQNFQNTRFSTLAGTSILSGTTPYTGTYRPAGNLAIFNGEKSSGEWKLIINNHSNERNGVLAAWGLRIKTPPATHVFTWDTFASGFFGQSDNVVIRMVAYAQPLTTTLPLTGTYRYTNSTGGSYQRPYASATTFPFRVRGTQVQVYRDTITPTAVVSNAIIYRLPNPATRGAQPIADASGRPFVTDAYGYLQGRGEIAKGDHLVALLPITYTTNYTLYYTSATPTLTGLEMYTVTQPGVQPLVVTAQHPLLLFNLTVALEWDARNDQPYKDQLRAYLQRTSALLYNWTNGQAALGNITIYHDRQHWNDANIRILASNRLRPNSDQGGIISIPLTETVTITKNGTLTTTTLAYHPGQVRMPVFWNRFGVADGGSLGEDWPRTLAHELGHYLLFLYDNYLGFDDHDAFVVVTKSACPGVMTDPYRTDNFVIATDWLKRLPEDKPRCENTASNRIAGRADWATIASHYPLITPTMPYTGPNTLPLAVTYITFAELITPAVSTAFAVPIYSLFDQAEKPYVPSGQARAFLFAPDRLIDLGHPIGDQIKAWGASPGQRLCLFDPPYHYSGCKTLTSSDSELRLQQHQGWPPAITVRPVTSSTIQITVTGVITPLRLHAQLYPVNAISATLQSIISLTPTVRGYIGEFTQVPTDTREAYLHIWTGDQLTDDSLQIVTDFAIGGNPVDTIANAQPGCYSPISGWRCSLAPVLSSDGQAMLLGVDLNLASGQFYAIQTVTQIPPTPSWTTVVGQAYRLLTSTGIPTLTNASLSLSYLTGEIPLGEKLTIYFYDETGTSTTWRPLTTTLQSEVNSAVASITQPGLYVLMSSLEVPLAGLGWNLIGYPVQESRPVTVALQSIDKHYKTVYGYDASDSDDPWKVYDVALPPLLNDLRALEFGHGYWVNITNTLGMTPTLQLKGTSPSTTTHQSPRATAFAFSLLRPPPATYWGELISTADITVTAFIEGVECGTTEIQKINGKFMYRIKVRAADPVNATERNCGTPGRMVTLTIGSQELATLPWDNNNVIQVRKPDQ